MIALRGTTFGNLSGWHDALDGISHQEVNEGTILLWTDRDPFEVFRKIQYLLPEGSFLLGSGLSSPTAKHSRMRDNQDVEHWLQEHHVQ